MSIPSSNIDFTKGNGLIPVVIQDASTAAVLMLGYQNEAAYQKTVSEGRVTFFSRSRNRLWTKGETSGNYLAVVSIHLDCDSDTLLIQVNAVGPTCHTGSDSCFGSVEHPVGFPFLAELANVIASRRAENAPKSYTASLFRDGSSRIAQKVGEEAVETVIEAMRGNNEKLIEEAADLVFHLMVLLENNQVSLSDVVATLEKRHR